MFLQTICDARKSERKIDPSKNIFNQWRKFTLARVLSESFHLPSFHFSWLCSLESIRVQWSPRCTSIRRHTTLWYGSSQKCHSPPSVTTQTRHGPHQGKSHHIFLGLIYWVSFCYFIGRNLIRLLMLIPAKSLLWCTSLNIDWDIRKIVKIREGKSLEISGNLS